jgi:hypothetical protein
MDFNGFMNTNRRRVQITEREKKTDKKRRGDLKLPT